MLIFSIGRKIPGQFFLFNCLVMSIVVVLNYASVEI